MSKMTLIILGTLTLISSITSSVQGQSPFTTTWNTNNTGTSNNQSITIPTTGTGYNYNVDWEGDGTYDDMGVTGSITHEYPEKGTYTVVIQGDFPRIYFNNSGDRRKLLTIEKWGDIEWSSMANAFWGCSNLKINTPVSPDLSNVTDMSNMFRDASTINSDLNNWEVGTVTNMSGLFFGASTFNGLIDKWNVANVENMTFMFREAIAFNGLLKLWNVTNVTIMQEMFREAIVFNGDISNWKVDSVTTMISMFRDAALFNRDISGWNPISLVDARFMFNNAILFNQDISMWDVSNVSTMSSMFSNAQSFNQNLGNWNVENVSSIGLANSGMGQSNYDQTLIGWASQNVQSDVSLNVTGLEYCNSEDARTFLDVTKTWSIIGDTQNCHFKTTWNTSNNGTSNNTSITIPTFPNKTYSYDIDWDGDGIFDEFGLTGNATHNYPVSGTYQVSIRGIFPHIYFNNTGDKSKIISIDQWGYIEWESMENAFYGCDQLIYKAADTPILSELTDLSGMFFNAVLMDANLGDWNIRRVTDMTLALSNTALSIENYDNTLIFWANQNKEPDVTLGVQGLEYCLSEIARSQLEADGWNILGDSKGCTGIDRPLILTVKTDNPGLSGNTAFKIQTWGGTIYNYDVDIGNDGTFEHIGLTGSWTLIFPSAGTHQIAIRGVFPRIYYNDQDDKDKLISIDQWGDQVWINMADAFKGCSNLEYNATDAPDLTQVADLSSMFSGATIFDGDLSNWLVDSITDLNSIFSHTDAFNGDISTWNVKNVVNMSSAFGDADAFNGDISNWDVGNVVQMDNVFRGASAFNQNLGDWNITSATTLFWMLRNCGMSISNYDQTLIGWASQNVNSNVTLSADGLQYCAGEEARNTLMNTYMWNITGDSRVCSSFLTTWNTNNPGTSNSTSVTIPTFPTTFTYNYDVDWNNDGIYEDIGVTGDITHDYGTTGIYTIAIRGIFPSIYLNNEGDCQKLIRIDQWGDNVWSYMNSAFEGASNMTYAAVDTPDLSEVLIAADMFKGATIFNGDLSGWNMSNVTSISGMFYDAELFNGNISTWEVGQVTNMREVFRNATNFNKDINGWDVSKVTSMYGMFDGATSFNQHLNSWIVSKVNSMQFMFKGATSFNGNISNWNVEMVTSMGSMFDGASSFDGDISLWSVNNVDNMNSMFKSATSFNGSIGSWIVNSVANMNFMFNNATSFNQDLGGWLITNANSMIGMLSNSGLSTSNYDNTLIGWLGQAIQSNVTLNASGLHYCIGENAHDALISTHGWTITGDSKDCNVQCGDPVNTWNGPASGNWNTAASWSLGTVPDECDNVVIPDGKTITIPPGFAASCYSIEVATGGSLLTEDGGELQSVGN